MIERDGLADTEEPAVDELGAAPEMLDDPAELDNAEDLAPPTEDFVVADRPPKQPVTPPINNPSDTSAITPRHHTPRPDRIR